MATQAAIAIRAEISRLQRALSILEEGEPQSQPQQTRRNNTSSTTAPKRVLSQEAKERIRQAQLRRWNPPTQPEEAPAQTAEAPPPVVEEAQAEPPKTRAAGRKQAS